MMRSQSPKRPSERRCQNAGAKAKQGNQLTSPPRDEFDSAQLDPGIATAVRVLREAGVETVWSCEGGEGHSSRSPYVVFNGDLKEARRVVKIARDARLGPRFVMRKWHLVDEELPESVLDSHDNGGQWEITFAYKMPIDSSQEAAHRELWQRRNERSDKESRETERRRKELFPRLLKLEPRLEELHRQVVAGGVDFNDLWLTYFSYSLQWIVGVNRQDDGHELLFTDEALDAALVGLYDAIPDGQAVETRVMTRKQDKKSAQHTD